MTLDLAERLRAALHDEHWSLDPWPDHYRRLLSARRRRQRRQVVVSTVFVVLAVAVSVPLALNAGGSGDRRMAPVPASTPSIPSPVPSHSTTPQTLPSVAASGYPVSVYPPSISAAGTQNIIPRCPSTLDIQRPSHSVRAEAVKIAEAFQTQEYSYSHDLHDADRAIWPEIYTPAERQKHNAPSHAFHLPVLSSGPLLGKPSGGGAPDPAQAIQRYCPSAVAENSYEVAIGPRDNPAVDGIFVFLERAGHVLLYYDY